MSKRQYNPGEWTRIDNDFRKSFGVSFRGFFDPVASYVYGRIAIDIVALEEFLFREGYKEDGVSMEDFVGSKYGDNANKLINQLL